MTPREQTLLFDRYRLRRRIGRGGAGVVWQATDELLDLDVALKLVRLPAADGLAMPDGGVDPETERLHTRVLREARSAARLRGHRNVVAVYNVLTDDEGVYLVMEYVSGPSLRQVLRSKGTLPAAEVAAIGAQIADAIAAAHRLGVIHRDITPGNVLFGPYGAARLTDFGISMLDGDPRLTEEGGFSGTLPYLAPEVVQTAVPVPSSDVFSLGAVLYEALEGEPPFGREDNTMLQLQRIIGGEIRPPMPGTALGAIVQQLLSLDPARRPTAAQAVDLLAAPNAQLPSPSVEERHVGSTARPVPEPAVRTIEPVIAPVIAPAVAPLVRARRSRRLAPVAAVLAACLLLAAGLVVGLGGGPVAGSAISGVQRGVPPVPRDIGPVSIDGDPRTADPCALVDHGSLRQFGRPREAIGFLMESCRTIIVTASNVELTVDVYFDDPVGSVTDIDGDREQVGAVTLVREPLLDDGACSRAIVLTDNSVIQVEASFGGSDDGDSCEVADVAAATALIALDRAGVGHDPQRIADFRIGRSDACAVLTAPDLAVVAGLDPGARLPGFANWSCDYGIRVDGQPQVYLLYRIDDAYINDNGEPTTVAGRQAHIEVDDGVFNARMCRVWVVQRQAPSRTAQAEKFSLQVDADQPEQTSCEQALALAAVVVGRLPS